MNVQNTILPLPHPHLRIIGALADEAQVQAYVVGGYVRDLLLGRPGNDIDVVLMGDAQAFAQRFADRIGVSTVVSYERFGTAFVPVDGGKIEFVTARTESYAHGSRKPDVRPGSLADDLRRRDFTVNALAVSLNAGTFGVLEDPFDGRGDLARRVLRTPLDPVETYDDDPLRIMRAIRFAAKLDFAIDEPSRAAISTMCDRLGIVSQERITDEFLKMLSAPRPSIALRLMYDTGVLAIVFPEVAAMAGVDQRREFHHKDVFLHTCQVVDNMAQATENVWLRFVALVHDIAKPRTKAFKEGTGWTFHGHQEVGARMMKKIFHRMRLPLAHLPYVEKLVRLHLRPQVLVDDEVTDSAIRRVMFEAGEDIDDLMGLCRADITSKNPSLVQRYLRNYDRVIIKIREVEEKDRLRNWRPPVMGDEIMAVFGLSPGKEIGLMKKAVEEAILDGRIPNDHDAALKYLLESKDAILGP